jgi:hypothetical protein
MRTWLPAVIALLAIPAAAPAQTRRAARDEVVWHWYGECAGADSLALEVFLDNVSIYSAAFPICQARRGGIKPERQQRLLSFRFTAVPRRFGPRSRASDPEAIDANIWEAANDPSAITFGLSLATREVVLINMHHFAPARSAARSERVRGLVIATRPLPRAGKKPR